MRHSRHRQTHPAASRVAPLSERVIITVGVTYTSPRVDNDFATFPSKRVTLGGYGLWHLASDYTVNKTITLTARINDLFDKNYSELQGWGSQDIAGDSGAKLQF